MSIHRRSAIFCLAGAALWAAAAASSGAGANERRTPVVELTPGMAILSPEVAGTQWTTRADFADPRTATGVEGASASLIGGTIYVSHGYRAGDTAYLSSFDPVSNVWTHGGAGLPDAPGSGQSEMGGDTIGSDHYAVGGRNGPTSEVYRFTPGGGWSAVASLPAPRGGLGVASWGGRIYAIGGRDGGAPFSGNVFGTNEVYDPGSNSWSPLAPLPVPVSDNYATIAVDGRIYVFGGWDGVQHTDHVQIYDIAGNSWSSGAAMPTPRSAAMAGELCGEIAVFGGSDLSFEGREGYEGEEPGGAGGTGCLDVTEFYDPATDSWSPGPAMPVPACEIAQGVTSNGLSAFAVGSGIEGAALMVVQELQCAPVIQAIPALTWGLPIFAAILALAALALFWRRARRIA